MGMLQAIVNLVGTINCEALFQLSAERMQKVRDYYGVAAGRQLRFSTSAVEPSEKGDGWWKAIGDGIHVDAALRALANIDHALGQKLTLASQQVMRGLAQLRTQEFYHQLYRSIGRQRLVVKVKVGPFMRTETVVKVRALDATMHKKKTREQWDRERVQAIRYYLDQLEGGNSLIVERVQSLQQKFARA